MKPATGEKTGTFRMQDLDLIDSLKASNVRKDPTSFFQDSVQQSAGRDIPVREEFRQRLLASDPDEELEINMSASDLQIMSEMEVRNQTGNYSAQKLQISSQIPLEIHSSVGDMDYRQFPSYDRMIKPQQQMAVGAVVAMQYSQQSLSSDDEEVNKRVNTNFKADYDIKGLEGKSIVESVDERFNKLREQFK